MFDREYLRKEMEMVRERMEKQFSPSQRLQSQRVPEPPGTIVSFNNTKIK